MTGFSLRGATCAIERQPASIQVSKVRRTCKKVGIYTIYVIKSIKILVTYLGPYALVI